METGNAVTPSLGTALDGSGLAASEYYTEMSGWLNAPTALAFAPEQFGAQQ
jgi:hypothetical protein